MLLSRIGPIALEEPLGGSADSNVLRGIHLERNRTLAVKLLARQVVDRPMGGDAYPEDVKRLQKLVHPHIARVLGGAMEQGQPYLAMELIKGESLRDLLDRRGRLPWETMVEYAQQICEALVYAHGQGTMHTRLTPKRVLIADDNSVKLVGFDCALGDHDAIVSLKAPLEVLNYLAPQEIRGKRSVGLESNDLFSLGVILYEGLCGELPWPANTPAELIRAREAAPAPRASAKVLDLPVWLDVLVARLLLVKREGRFESADEARRAILAAKDKTAAGLGAAKHALSGKQGALAPNVDKQELSRLRKAAAAKAPKEAAGAIYERAWFLAACLAALVGLGVWFMWPLGEDALYAKAKPLMDSQSPADWHRAQNQYVDELLRRFPNTQYLDEVTAFQFRHAVQQAEERIKNVDRFQHDFKWDADRKYYEARRDEQIGSSLSAWEKYEALIAEFAASETLEERAVVELARRRIAAIRAAARDDSESLQLTAEVEEKLDHAERLAAEGKRVEARAVLEDLIELYADQAEVAGLVEKAQERVRDLRANGGAAGD
jgi:serine/threonine protein kinase